MQKGGHRVQICKKGINEYKEAKFAQIHTIKGCGMGPWLVLVSPCFRENVVATCKIGSFFV